MKKDVSKWEYLLLFLAYSVIFLLRISSFASKSFFNDYVSYDNLLQLQGAKVLIESQLDSINLFFRPFFSILGIDISMFLFIGLSVFSSILVYFILVNTKVMKKFALGAFFLSLFVPLTYLLNNSFTYTFLEVFLFLLLIFVYLKSVENKKYFYLLLLILPISLVLSVKMFVFVISILVLYFFSLVFDFQFKHLIKESSVFIFFLSFTVFVLFYGSFPVLDLNFNFVFENFLQVGYILIAIIYLVKTMEFNYENISYFSMFSFFSVLIGFYFFSPENSFFKLALYYILVIFSGYFFHWFSKFMKITKLKSYRLLFVVGIFLFFLVYSVNLSYENLNYENEHILNSIEISSAFKDFEEGKFAFLDKKLSTIVSYYAKYPVVHVLHSKSEDFVSEYNSKNLNIDKIMILNQNNIKYVDSNFAFNDRTCMYPFFSLHNETIYRSKCYIS